MGKFLVQHLINGAVFPQILTTSELINYINMSDCHDGEYEIFDCMSEFGKVKKLHYVGWQPNCLIEVADEDGNVVLRGYGEDH